MTLRPPRAPSRAGVVVALPAAAAACGITVVQDTQVGTEAGTVESSDGRHPGTTTCDVDDGCVPDDVHSSLTSACNPRSADAYNRLY